MLRKVQRNKQILGEAALAGMFFPQHFLNNDAGVTAGKSVRLEAVTPNDAMRPIALVGVRSLGATLPYFTIVFGSFMRFDSATDMGCGLPYDIPSGGPGDDTLTVQKNQHSVTILDVIGGVICQAGQGGTTITVVNVEHITLIDDDGLTPICQYDAP